MYPDAFFVPTPIKSPARTQRAAIAAIAGAAFLALAPPSFAQGGAAQQAQQQPPPLSDQARNLPPAGVNSFAPVVRTVMPAVVNLSVTQRTDVSDEETAQEDNGGLPQFPPGSPLDQFMRRFFDQEFGGRPGAPPSRRPNAQRVALGSGFIIDPTGFVVTNNHVVSEADKVTVIMQDNSRHAATIIGRDKQTDLALVKISVNRPLPYVGWADSDKAEVGDWILAVGNPFGLGGSVTAGIISARGRDIHSGPYDDFLQVDASINRGNSGGPTFNLQGQVVGINTAIYSPSGGSVGIGFAIPANLAQQVIGQLRTSGKVSRGWLGVQIQEVSPQLARKLGLDPNNPQGAVVADVTPNSPAARAGVRVGDVITQFNGQKINSVRDLPRLVAETPVGQNVSLQVLRNRNPVTLQTAIAEMPTEQQQASNEQGSPGDNQQPDQATPSLGLQLAPLTGPLQRRLGLPQNASGVVVTGVADGSPAQQAGLEPGDVILQIDQKPVSNPQEATNQLRQALANDPKGDILLLIKRRGTNEFVTLPTGQG